MSRTFAYLRVSTTDQSVEGQRLELASAGFTIEPRRIVAETVSGSVPAARRAGFARLLDRLEEGDLLVVTRLDRLGRDVIDVKSTVERLAAGGIRVACLALGGVDLTSAAGKMTMGVIAAVAEFERDLLVERTRAGLARARAEGRRPGRPPRLSAPEQSEVAARLGAGETVSVLARRFRVSRQTILRIRDRAGGPKDRRETGSP